MAILIFEKDGWILVAAPPLSPESGGGAAGGPDQPSGLTGVVGRTWGYGAWSKGKFDQVVGPTIRLMGPCG